MKSQASLLLPIALLFIGAPAVAQTARSGNTDARVMQQLQQITGEKTALQAENTELKRQVEQLRKDLATASSAKSLAENKAKALQANASRGEQSDKQAEEQLERTRGQLQELVTKFRETAQTLRDVETDRATVKTELAAQQRDFKTCVDRNAGLYNLNTEILDRMEKRGFWSSVTEREPFTRIKRTQLENLIDDYRYRAEELKPKQVANGG
jgi:chromosome segregation ATPase